MNGLLSTIEEFAKDKKKRRRLSDSTEARTRARGLDQCSIPTWISECGVEVSGVFFIGIASAFSGFDQEVLRPRFIYRERVIFLYAI